MIKIAVFDTKPYDQKSFEEIVAVEPNYKNFEIKFFNNRLNKDTAKLAQDFEVVCAFVNDTLDKDVIEMLANYKVKLIALRCAGYNNVDVKFAYQKIHIVRVPAYSPYAVAEHAVALMMSLNRKTHKAFYRTNDRNFSINGLLGFDMHGKVAGVIGTGKIGRCLINILRGFGMKVLAYDSFPGVAENFEYVSLDELYQKSDIISLHCPLTPETQYLINEKSISKMKENVMIINTGRGELINTKDLISALKAKKIGSAGLDVYEEEGDYFFEDFSNVMLDDDVLARLLTFPNVLVTSHQAFFTKEALRNIAQTTLNNIVEYFDGGYLQNEVCYQCEQKNQTCPKKEKSRCF